MTEREYHVASFVVSTHPKHSAQVARDINAMPGLEVHAEQQGKLVVTAEAHSVGELAELTGSLEQVDSVIVVAPVYHEYAGAERSAASMPHAKQRQPGTAQ